MSKRIGYCEYCSVPLIEDDRHCVGCGAPAIVLEESAHEKDYGWRNWVEPIFAPDPNCFGQFLQVGVVSQQTDEIPLS